MTQISPYNVRADHTLLRVFGGFGEDAASRSLSTNSLPSFEAEANAVRDC